MKKVLLIKIEAPSYSSIGMENAFKEAFEEVHSIDWQKVRFNGGVNGLAILWEQILAECLSFMPDLIFCQFQRPILTTEQYKRLSDFGFVINYTEDVREDISWYEDVAPHIGLTIFTNWDDVEKLGNKGINNVAYMPVSYNDVWYKPQPKTEKYYGDIVFIGNNFVGTNLNFPQAQERQDMCKFMEEKFGDKFQAYGIGQKNQALSPVQCVEAYNNCKVAVTQGNFKRGGYFSDRNLNAMACGAITLQHYSEGMEEMFKDAPYFLSWESFDSLIAHCNLFINHVHLYDSLMNKKMPEYIKENHTWRNRIKMIKGFKIFIEGKNISSPINT